MVESASVATYLTERHLTVCLLYDFFTEETKVWRSNQHCDIIIIGIFALNYLFQATNLKYWNFKFFMKYLLSPKTLWYTYNYFCYQSLILFNKSSVKIYWAVTKNHTYIYTIQNIFQIITKGFIIPIIIIKSTLPQKQEQDDSHQLRHCHVVFGNWLLQRFHHEQQRNPKTWQVQRNGNLF